GDDDAGTAVAVVEEVEVVAADDARSRVALGDLVAADRRRRLRQETLLDAPGQGQIVRFDRALGRAAALRRDQPRQLAGDAEKEFLVGGAPRLRVVRAVEIQRA